MAFQVEEDGIVHRAIGLLGDDLEDPRKKTVILTGFACDEIAIGRVVEKHTVSSGRRVTCLMCNVETRH